VKNTTTYKQYDSRWRWWVYPKKGWYLNGCGCGCLSVFHCVLELEKYLGKSVTDIMKMVYSYMKQYAVAGDGTKRDGITAGLKHFGFADVYRCGSAPMSELFKRLNKEGAHVGVLLFRGKGPDGTVWTSGGHYIGYGDYRVRDGRHEFYLFDSGSRNHSGWYSYEKSMRGCVIDAWSATIPKSQKKPSEVNSEPYKGALPNTTVEETKTVDNTAKISAKAKALAWAKGTAKAKYAYKGGSGTAAYNRAYKAAYPDRSGWSAAPKKGCACDVYVGTVVRSSGLDKDYPRGVTPAINSHKSKAFDKLTYRNVSPYSVSRNGDIVCYFKDKAHKSAHTLIRADGVIYEAQLAMTYPHVNGSLSKLKTKRPVVVIFRARPTKTTVTRSYLHKGDKGTEVLKWQKFLNWYFGGKVVAEDGDFGQYTKEYTVKFQTAVGVTADGTVGYQTVAKAREARR